MRLLFNDIRIAIRLLSRAPAFTAAAVLTLSLALGANTAIFTLVRSLAFDPFPALPQVGRVMWFFETTGKVDADRDAIAPAAFERWKRDAHTLEHFTALKNADVNLSDWSAPERVRGLFVSPSYFSAIGVSTLLGRPLAATDERAGGQPVVVLSEGLWRRRFGADPGIIGKTISTDGRRAQVVGVMAATTTFPKRFDLLLPLVLTDAERADWQNRAFGVIARLKDGVSTADAQAEIGTIAARIASDHAETHRGVSVSLIPVDTLFTAPARAPLLALLGAVIFLLGIACSNLASLNYVRNSMRAREFATRMALGATTGRVATQLLAESLVVAAFSAALGLAIGRWGLDALVGSLPSGFIDEVPRLRHLSIDVPVLLFVLAVSVAAGIAFGLAPALRMARVQPSGILNSGGRGATGMKRRLARAIVALQVGLSFVLVVGAGLMVRTLMKLDQADPGFNGDHVTTVSLALTPPRYPTAASMVEMVNRATTAAAALAGVEAVAAGTGLPMGDLTGSATVRAIDLPRPEQLPWGRLTSVTDGYFRTLGIKLFAGREFQRADGEGASPVALISRRLATLLFGDNPQAALNRMLEIEGAGQRRIVGIVDDILDVRLNSQAVGEVYVPYAQLPGTPYLVVRFGRDLDAATADLRTLVQGLDRDLPLAVQTLSSVTAEALAPRRLLASLFIVLAVLALGLACFGVFGVVAHGVSQRTRELGIRIALGADSQTIVRSVVFQGLRAAALGVAGGLVIAFLVSRLMSAVLYGVEPLDPVTFAIALAALLGSVLLASFLPARRAAQISPAAALRTE